MLKTFERCDRVLLGFGCGFSSFFTAWYYLFNLHHLLLETERFAFIESCKAITGSKSILVETENLDRAVGFHLTFSDLIFVEDQFLDHWTLDVW